MRTLYETISSLCATKGVKPGRLCSDLGFSRSTMSDLKMGRKKTLSADYLAKISEYFSVSIEYLLGTEQEKAPTPEGERPITFDDFTYAMYEEGKELTAENKKKLLEMAAFFRQQQEKDKK